MISSQIGSLDKIFSGGLQNGIITEISGLRGTGKTQLALQFAIEPLINNKKILFVDTTVEFRPERFLQMLQSRNLSTSILENLHVSRITDTQKQIEILKSIEKDNFSLLIIDNITDLFSFEYSKKEQSFEKHLAFMKYMQNLASVAINTKIPIVVTNIIRSFNEHEQENLEKSIGMFTHVKIKLKKNTGGFLCQVVSPFINKKFQYNVTPNGLIDES
mgnify:CR=1 FL=1